MKNVTYDDMKISQCLEKASNYLKNIENKDGRHQSRIWAYNSLR